MVCARTPLQIINVHSQFCLRVVFAMYGSRLRVFGFEDLTPFQALLSTFPRATHLPNLSYLTTEVHLLAVPTQLK